MITAHEKHERRARRTRFRIKTVNKNGLCRLSIHVSNRFIRAQVIDDTCGRTLAASDSGALTCAHPNEAAAKIVGRDIAQKVLLLGITQVIFDKGGRVFGKRFQAFTESARLVGLNC